jgi:hypothetical protein
VGGYRNRILEIKHVFRFLKRWFGPNLEIFFLVVAPDGTVSTPPNDKTQQATINMPPLEQHPLSAAAEHIYEGSGRSLPSRSMSPSVFDGHRNAKRGSKVFSRAALAGAGSTGRLGTIFAGSTIGQYICPALIS